jgi:hypothetical protein
MVFELSEFGVFNTLLAFVPRFALFFGRRADAFVHGYAQFGKFTAAKMTCNTA